MLRATTSTLSRTALRYSARGTPALGGVGAPRCLEFHATSLKKEEEKKEAKEVVPEKPGRVFWWWRKEFNYWLAVMLGVPAGLYDWIPFNEETLLASCTMCFFSIVYINVGPMIHESLAEQAKEVLKEHQEGEDACIAALEKLKDDLKISENLVEDIKDVNTLREETYIKLNAAGAIKPKYDFKSQMEKILNAIEAEETNVREKAKLALMEEATASVEEQFASSKQLQKAALDDAIAKIKGADSGEDPVKAAFVQFFQQKAASASNVDEAAEAASQRAAMIAKLNATAANEGFYFKFDKDGQPMMAA